MRHRDAHVHFRGAQLVQRELPLDYAPAARHRRSDALRRVRSDLLRREDRKLPSAAAHLLQQEGDAQPVVLSKKRKAERDAGERENLAPTSATLASVHAVGLAGESPNDNATSHAHKIARHGAAPLPLMSSVADPMTMGYTMAAMEQPRMEGIAHDGSGMV